MHVWILTGITFLHYADNRSIGCTQMNEKSSRSHTIFSILLESRVCDQSDSDTVNLSCLVRLYGGGGGGGGVKAFVQLCVDYVYILEYVIVLMLKAYI